MQVIDSQHAFQAYCSRLDSDQKEGADFDFDFTRLPWAIGAERLPSSGKKDEAMQEKIENELILQQESPQRPHHDFSLPIVAKDVDGDEVRVCKQCYLPIGDVFYTRGQHRLHGECNAQCIVEIMQDWEKSSALNRVTARDKQYAAYDIGWDVTRIPKNSEVATKLAMRDVPEGMLCVVLNDDGMSVRLGSTWEVAGAINLEYLSTALRVRRVHGKEPRFSLDIADCTNNNSMLVKSFTPDWLASTKAGDVLFQADYHLKASSMGICEQPVIGMKSANEHCNVDRIHDWKAREWFMVRKAEVLITESNMLIPVVKMGVEACEQVVIDAKMTDQPVTKQNHPMVKYAREFTRNFDLIAERKSVIYHLRELAKVTVLAKHLIESGSSIEESWFHLTTFSDEPFPLEVPQLWNERVSFSLPVQKGRIERNARKHVHSVYGGVILDLQKFKMTTQLAITALASTKPHLALSTAQLSPLQALSQSPFAYSTYRAIASPALLRAPTAPLSKQGSLMNVKSRLLRVPPSPLFACQTASPVPPRMYSQGFSIAAGLRTRSRFKPGASILQSARRALEKPEGAALSTLTSKALPTLGRVPTIAPFRLGTALKPTEILGGKAGTPAKPTGSLGGKAGVLLSGRPGPLRGVDLSLDDFEVSEAKSVSLQQPAGNRSWQVGALDDCVAIGSAFFSALDGSEKIFKHDDHALLKNVFHPVLSDRRSDGAMFVPPDVSFSYLNVLRQLTKDEEIIKRKRKDHFLSASFKVHEPGDLFPLSWVPTCIATRGEDSNPEGLAPSNLQACPEYKDWAALRKMLKTAAVIFDRCAEDGCRFRIYRLGKLEVRTLQDTEDDEVLGMVFWMGGRRNNISSNVGVIDESEKIVMVTEYVEPTSCGSKDSSEVPCHYFLVCETRKGDQLILERATDKTCVWSENPLDFELRTSRGKVMRTKAALEDVTVQYMKDLQADIRMVPLSDKRFVQQAFLSSVRRDARNFTR